MCTAEHVFKELFTVDLVAEITLRCVEACMKVPPKILPLSTIQKLCGGESASLEVLKMLY